MAAQNIAGAFLRGQVGGTPCSSQPIIIPGASSGPCSTSTLPFPLGSSPSFHHHGIHSHLHSPGEFGNSLLSRKGRLWSCEGGTAPSRGYRDVGVTAVASFGGLLGGLFKGNDTAEATRQQYAGTVTAVNVLEVKISQLSDEELRAKTAEFKERLVRGESLDSLLPEAFAVVREASKRILGLRPFDVQLIGGMVLHKGEIAEMRTGEGKTLVAVLPAYLNALTGKGVHMVTVNDYLARRDCEWVGQVPRFLGLNVGLIQQNMSSEERRANYSCDMTYVTNSELGFDYLRDNLATTIDELVQRRFNFCIIDEVDSILIDEARTPLIISGLAEKPSDRYYKAAKIANAFVRDIHYTEEVEKESPGLMKEAERYFILTNIDRLWKEHLQALKFVQQAVGLRGYAQRDPLIEYKLEGYNLFLDMMAKIRRNVIYSVYQFKAVMVKAAQSEQANKKTRKVPNVQERANGTNTQRANDDDPIPAAQISS